MSPLPPLRLLRRYAAADFFIFTRYATCSPLRLLLTRCRFRAAFSLYAATLLLSLILFRCAILRYDVCQY